MLKKLETKINNEPIGALKIIANIQKAYEESFHSHSLKYYSGLFFLKDKKSEQLYQLLINKELPVFSKAQAIEEFMKTRNKNAGKILFNIILDEIESDSAHNDDFLYLSNWDYPPEFHAMYI